MVDKSIRLDVESLRAFREVVSQDGFTAAASRLGLSQPAVSKKVQRLEEQLGSKLLRRNGHSLVLTQLGHELLAHAGEIVEVHDRAVERIAKSPVEGAVRLGCNEEVAAQGLSEVVGRFSRSHPHIDLAICVRDSAYVADWLDEGAVDIALLQVIDADEAIRSTDEVWRRDGLEVVQGHSADFDDADPVPLVSFGPRCLYEPWLVKELVGRGLGVRHAMECPSIQGVQRAIEAGIGVGVLNTPNVTDHMRPWAEARDLSLPSVAFVLRTCEDARGDEAVAALRGHLTSALRSA